MGKIGIGLNNVVLSVECGTLDQAARSIEPSAKLVKR